MAGNTISKLGPLEWRVMVIEIRDGEEKFYGMDVNFSLASWDQTLRFALGWFLFPVMTVLSKLLKKRIAI